MDLQDYFAIIRRRWVLIAVVTLLALGVAGVATALKTPLYQSRAQVFVSVRTAGGTTSDLVQGSSFTQRQVKSYTDLVTSPRVLNPVIEQLNLPTTADQLGERIKADTPLDTVLINITVTDENPQRASDLANATAGSLAAQVRILEKPSDAAASPVEINTVRTATPAPEPFAPSRKLNLAIGLLAGLALGTGLAVLRDVLDTLVRSQADVEKITETSVIATIGFDVDARAHPLMVRTNPRSHRSEAFRRLRTNLQFLDISDRPNTIVITSSVPGEGKSTTAINLAITLADAGTRVALIDADLRRPSVADYMGLEGGVGLTTVLIGQATLQDVTRPWGSGHLHVLPSGAVPPNPSELLGSAAMARVLEQVSHDYDIVLIDTPPLIPVTDAAILARFTAGAVVVVGADRLHRQQLKDALGSLDTAGARVLGIALNRIARLNADPYSYYDYHSDSTSSLLAAAPGAVRRTTSAWFRWARRRPSHAPSHR